MSHDYKDFFKAAKSAKAHNKAKVKQHKAVKSHDKHKKPLVTSARKKSLLPPIIPSLLIICGLLLTGWGYMNLDEVLDFIYRIEVSPIQGL
ncbi:MAG: hypothetical protein KDD40_08525, partial [Bdellovibrionales bacterium]|nr:hypothetical protein [Bdellovibrionales bacterium]